MMVSFKASCSAVIRVFYLPQLPVLTMYIQKSKRSTLLSEKTMDHSDLIAPFLSKALTCIYLTEKIKCFHHPAILSS